MQVRFKLVRYFATTSLAAFCCAAVALAFFQTRESRLVQSVQDEQSRAVQDMQARLVERAELAARRDLLSLHESSNLSLTRLLSNALWDDALAPFLAAAKSIDLKRCPGATEAKGHGSEPPPTADSKECVARLGTVIQALPAFTDLDNRVRHAMRGNSVVKIKIYDLQGITLYSTDLAQIGEDRSGHAHWITAARQGKASSEVAFQERYNTLRGAVQNRDLIASYLPMIDPRAQKTVGVFEVYADISLDLKLIEQTSAGLRQTADLDQEQLARQSQDQRARVQGSARLHLLVLAALLVLLYVVLHSIVRRAQGVIEQQARESDANRQRLAQSEKMTSLGQMVAGVAHQLNTPLAFSKSNVFMAVQALEDMVPDIEDARLLLEPASAGYGDADHQTLPEAGAVRSKLRRFPDDIRMAQDMLGDVLMGLEQMNELWTTCAASPGWTARAARRSTSTPLCPAWSTSPGPSFPPRSRWWSDSPSCPS
jgi:two-component system, NtrC family, sensor kinase